MIAHASFRSSAILRGFFAYICGMPPPLIVALLLLCLVSCNSDSRQQQLKKDLTGDWLVLYADHKLTNSEQRRIYGQIQDSIITIRGLKLVQFHADGSFQQLDKPVVKGKWNVTDKEIYIIEGGEGFTDFHTEFFDFKDDVLRTAEFIKRDDETIKLVWHLKKIDGSSLFKDAVNLWRKKPEQPETDQQIKTRLSDMLGFYADYYRLVSKESSYFIPSRIAAPLNFYQHAIGMKEFDGQAPFAGFFYDSTQAAKAYEYLSQSLLVTAESFPSGGSYVDEYAKYMEMLSRQVMKL